MTREYDVRIERDYRVLGGRRIPLGDLAFEDHFYGQRFHVLAAIGGEYGAKAALANSFAQRVMLIEELECLFLGEAVVVVGGKFV